VHAKGTGNIINKIIAENFPSLEKEVLVQIQEVPRTPANMTKIEPLQNML
jgi:hypothetical protein